MPVVVTPAPERFWRMVEKSSSCWVWTGATCRYGYGIFGVTSSRKQPRKTMVAHKFAYELIVGPVPEGLVLDHLCRNTRCVNPEHLEAVTQLENVHRSTGNASKTHCKHGHPFSGANLAIVHTGGRARRRCVTCRRAEYHRRMKLLRDAS